jgi:hypothetical protein
MTPDSRNQGPGEEWAATEFESPFASDPFLRGGTATIAATAPAQVFGRPRSFESPFIAEYVGEDVADGAQAELVAEMMDELYDAEFDEVLEDLVNEAAIVAEQQPAYETDDSAAQRRNAERAVRSYLEPLQRASERMLEGMEAGLQNRDPASLSEAEVDALTEQRDAFEVGFSPTFENFLGKLARKAKAALKKVSSVLPHSLVLNRLKGLVNPLLARVLRFALNKLPAAIRPAAQQLARRLLKVSEVAESAATDAYEAAAADPAILQEEFDAELAGSLLAGEEFEQEAALERTLAEASTPSGDPLRELERARHDFVRQISSLQEGEDPIPAVERFAPAVLAALKLGIKVVGRPRVVNFLARLVAKLIERYVGRQQATALSRALVDAGLGLVSLEAPGADPIVAGEALASTVEDTLRRVVRTAPEAAWEQEALLEAYTVESFQQAAAAHFPDSLIRAELHEAAQASGAWVALPSKTPRKRYKKYTRVLDVTLTPQTAAAVKTFGGVSLADFIKDRLGMKADHPIRARVHLYEAIPGTTLSLIAYHEKNVAGLGSGQRGAFSLFHPLTAEAAAALLNEPGLGRPASPEFLANRRHIEVGQRLYYLEIPGARVRLVPAGRGGIRPARSTTTRIVLDFPRRKLRLRLFFAEAEAQELLKALRKKLPVPSLLGALKARHEPAIERMLTDGSGGRGLRIVHAAAMLGGGDRAPAIALQRLAGRPLAALLRSAMIASLRQELETRLDSFSGSFERAAAAEADGVTVMLTFNTPPLLEHLRPLLKPGAIAAAPALLAALSGRSTLGEPQVDITAGFE